MTHELPVGIDLGTTFSAVAYVDAAGRTQMVRNAEGEILTPSVVLFSDVEVVVGKEARRATVVRPELVAQWVKRDMGLPLYHQPIHGRQLPPEVIQACILRRLKHDVHQALGGQDRVVITVPAYFDEPRRKATADAGEMAGLKVLDIVNEPTAAALSFGECLGYLSPEGMPQNEMTILVYDLGGGTFDATLLKLAPGKIQTLATDGDVMLGGYDWDLRLADYAADRFREQYGSDPREDPAGLSRILMAVVEAKHTLSARGQALIFIEHGGRRAEITVARRQFEEMTADLLERTAYTVRQLVQTAGLKWDDVDRVLLVGGSTRMPMVVGLLREMSGKEPDHTVNPDEAVARGAALYAAYLRAKERGEEEKLLITNVNSHGLGVEGIEPVSLRRKNVVILPRNTPLPAEVTERFATKSEGQRSIVVQVLEGESLFPNECTVIGRTVIRDLPDGLPQNWPVDITFQYAANGRLSIHAVVPGTHQEATLLLERASGISGEGIARWKRPVGEAAGFDAFESMLEEVFDLESLPQTPAATSEATHLPHSEEAAPPVPDPADNEDADARKLSGRRAAGTFSASPSPSREPADSTSPAVPEAKSAVEPDPPGAVQLPVRDVTPRSRWLFRVIGHVIFALLGLGLGYLVLHWIHPEIFRWPWQAP
ncbi:MAG: Hsp70 family protein [Pirellulales bacterium]|nr:Hsp70 family protein [Pirellulales bacterium]